VPPQLVVNFDQTGMHLVPTSGSQHLVVHKGVGGAGPREVKTGPRQIALQRKQDNRGQERGAGLREARISQRLQKSARQKQMQRQKVKQKQRQKASQPLQLTALQQRRAKRLLFKWSIGTPAVQRNRKTAMTMMAMAAKRADLK
jgi:hypothetical protein